MQHNFMQRVMMAMLAGLAAAALVWFYRHIVEQSRYEMNEGWRENLKGTPTQRR